MPRRRSFDGLDAQLCHALAHLEQGDQYKGYLNRVIRVCTDLLLAGEPAAATQALQVLNLPLHAAERLSPTFQGLEAKTWVMAAAEFLKVVEEAARNNPRLKQKVPSADRRVLSVLRDMDPQSLQPLRRAEIWRQVQPHATQAEVGQALTRCHDRLWVVRLSMTGPEGSAYRITDQGREALESLGV